MYQTREMMIGLRDPFTYFQCSECICLQIAEFPPEMSKYYPADYYSLRESESEHAVMQYLKKKRNRYAVFNRSPIGRLLYSRYPREDLRSLSYIEVQNDTSILDVGCGNGELLRILYQLGFTDLSGIDPYIEKGSFTIGEDIEIHKKSIHGLEGRWELIMLHHVFEHMAEPLRVLESVSRLLKPAGYCLIRTPVAGSAAWQTYRENWVQLDPPRHFHIHSPESLAFLVKKTDLTLIKTVYDSTSFQFWGSIQYENDISLHDETSYAVNPEASMFTAGDIKSFERKAENLNRNQEGDQAAFILQKK